MQHPVSRPAISRSDSPLLLRPSMRSAALACVAVLLLGCGEASTTTTTTSTEDIASFIEENPEYGNAPPAGPGSSDASPLGLER